MNADLTVLMKWISNQFKMETEDVSELMLYLFVCSVMKIIEKRLTHTELIKTDFTITGLI